MLSIRIRFVVTAAGVLLCGLTELVFPQTESANRVSAQSNTPAAAPIRVESDLVLVRVEVLDKKVWREGPTEAGRRCVQAEHEAFAHLRATEPYLPKDCEGLHIRGLATKDFHIFVDGQEQKIQDISTENAGIRVRDNLGAHNEYSNSPVGKWSTPDYSRPPEDYRLEVPATDSAGHSTPWRTADFSLE